MWYNTIIIGNGGANFFFVFIVDFFVFWYIINFVIFGLLGFYGSSKRYRR